MKIHEQALNEATFNAINSIDDSPLVDFIDGISAILVNDPNFILTNFYCLYRNVEGETLFDRLVEGLDRDLRELLMLAASRCPSDVVGEGRWPERNAIQASIAGVDSEGAAIAVSRHSGLISLALYEEIRVSRLLVKVSTLRVDDSSIIDSEHEVAHWYDYTSAKDYPGHRRQILRSAIENSSDLWALRRYSYPNLSFLDACREQLRQLEAREFSQVRQRLAELEECADSWPDGAPAPNWRSLVTPENPGRHQMCTFTNADGVATLYEWHARYTPGPGRIHFRLMASEKRLEIAYIGPKLGS